MAMTFMNVTMLGRATRDAEHREVQGKNGMFDATTLNLAVDRPYNAPKGQNGEVTTDFFRCELTGASAKYAQHVRKGMLVAVTGYFINPEPFTNQKGEVIKESQFRVDDIKILEKKADGQDDGGYQQNGGGYQQNNGGYNQNNGGYNQNQNGGGYQQNQNNGGGYNQNNGGYQQNGGGYNQNQNNGGGYNQNQNGGQNNGGYNQNQNGGSYQQNQNGGGGYNQNQNNGGGYNQNQNGSQNNGGYNQNQNNGGYQQNQSGPQDGFMNLPEGFGPTDDNPFGLGGAPNNY